MGDNHTLVDAEGIVASLEKQARWLTVVTVAQVAVSGGVLGWLVGPYFGATPTIMAVVFALAGALFGYAQGQSRRAQLQMQAVQLRMLAAIEKNTQQR